MKTVLVKPLLLLKGSLETSLKFVLHGSENELLLFVLGLLLFPQGSLLMVLVIPQASLLLVLLLVVFGTEVKPANISLLFVILLLFILVVVVALGLGLYTLPLSAGGGANKPLLPPPKVFPIGFFFNELLLLD